MKIWEREKAEEAADAVVYFAVAFLDEIASAVLCRAAATNVLSLSTFVDRERDCLLWQPRGPVMIRERILIHC